MSLMFTMNDDLFDKIYNDLEKEDNFKEAVDVLKTTKAFEVVGDYNANALNSAIKIVLEEIEAIENYQKEIIEKQQKEIEELKTRYEHREKRYTKYSEDNKKQYEKNLEVLQKEIEELEALLKGKLYNDYLYYKDLASEYQGSCISKQSIRDKLKEYDTKNLIINIGGRQNGKTFRLAVKEEVKKVLKELLGE